MNSPRLEATCLVSRRRCFPVREPGRIGRTLTNLGSPRSTTDLLRPCHYGKGVFLPTGDRCSQGLDTGIPPSLNSPVRHSFKSELSAREASAARHARVARHRALPDFSGATGTCASSVSQDVVLRDTISPSTSNLRHYFCPYVFALGRWHGAATGCFPAFPGSAVRRLRAHNGCTLRSRAAVHSADFPPDRSRFRPVAPGAQVFNHDRWKRRAASL